MGQLVTVREHARLTSGELPSSVVNAARIPASAFDWLVTESARLRGGENGARLVELESRRDLRLDNYVGVLESPCGTRIEILPKSLGPDDDITAGRRLLQRMLLRCLDLTPRQSNPTALQVFDAPLTEWVASQFLQVVDHLIKRGVRFDYHSIEEELRFLRGRLSVARTLRQPPGRAHLFQVEHDVFDADRAENRLIRSALDVVRKQTREPKSWRLACELAHYFNEIPPSRNLAEDFRQWRDDRLMAHYAPLRPWCSMILHEQMPLTLVGSQKGQSLLFPMEKVYEQFVGLGLRAWLSDGSRLISQASGRWLTRHREADWFQLRPDFLIEYDGQRIVADAKWKILDSTRDNRKDKYDLSEADFYQLFAYGQKFLGGAGTMYLFFPRTSRFTEPLPPFHFNDRLQLHVVPIDLDSGLPVNRDFLDPALQTGGSRLTRTIT